MQFKNILFFLQTLALTCQVAQAALQKHSYDPGPTPQDPMGKELIDLVAQIPNMPEISMQLMGEQKFRPAYGPVNWRMLLGKNQVKILFIGQDATHIAEAAGRTATAGFGGRGQDLAAYFGVNEAAGFINTFAYTIKGQYGAHQTPYVVNAEEGHSPRFGNLVENKLWLMSQDQSSPMVKWRNKLIDWIIRNNRQSLKLIVTFGGAARDSIAGYVESKGGKVGARNEGSMSKIQVALTELAYAGGNNEFPILVDRNGDDLYSKIMEKKINYEDAKQQEAVRTNLKENFAKYLSEMVFTQAGPLKNGLIHPAQIDGYDLNKMTINGKRTRSLRGITLNDGSSIDIDLLVVELPHPTYLSNIVMQQGRAEASKIVREDLKVLQSYVNEGWMIDADPGMVNEFALNKDYNYSRRDIGPEFYDFGAPGSRMVPVSDAVRMNPNVIIIGTRERPRFNMKLIEEMTKASPAVNFDDDELFISRPRSEKLRYTFDPGPGEVYAQLMKDNLPLSSIFTTKSGLRCAPEDTKDDREIEKKCDSILAKEGIEAFVVKSSPVNEDFGHYRGTFKNTRVLILADPHGYDDLITARAFTGSRGQSFHRLMEDLKVGDKYLVIKTLPFGMDEASESDWRKALEITSIYRKKLISKILSENNIEAIFADGKYAHSELKRIIKTNTIPQILIERSEDGNSADILAQKENLLKVFKNSKISGGSANIPRSHLSFYARIWEGTSGDRVITSNDHYRGVAFAEVAPLWASKQKSPLAVNPGEDLTESLVKLKESNLLMPGEKIPHYLNRRNIDGAL